MLYPPLCLEGKLGIVPVSASHDAYPFDKLEREGCNPLPFVAHQAQASDATAIGEDDVLAVGFQFPARLLVFHASVVVLETRIALLVWCVLVAAVIEPADSGPRTVSRRLTGL